MLFIESFRGTALESVTEIDDHHRQKLHAVSVTTVEELLSAIQAAPQAMADFMEGTDLPQLQADLAREASHAISVVEDAASDTAELEMALGAEPPEGMEIEEIALDSTFQAILSDFLEGLLDKMGESVDLCGCFGPVRDQGSRGTCVGHASAAVMEAAHHQSTGELIEFSPQFVFYNSKMADGAEDSDGTWSRVAMPTLLDQGICEETEWPYEPNVLPGDVHHGPPPETAVDNALRYLAGEVIELDPRDNATIREQIDAGRAVTISVPVYENWYGPMTRAYGKIPMPLPYSRLEGGHAMCVCGYDFDDEFTGGGYFMVRNSWGPEWAAKSPIQPGYAALPFEYIDRYGWEAFAVRLSGDTAS